MIRKKSPKKGRPPTIDGRGTTTVKRDKGFGMDIPVAGPPVERPIKKQSRKSAPKLDE